MKYLIRLLRNICSTCCQVSDLNFKMGIISDKEGTIYYEGLKIEISYASHQTDIPITWMLAPPECIYNENWTLLKIILMQMSFHYPLLNH